MYIRKWTQWDRLSHHGTGLIDIDKQSHIGYRSPKGKGKIAGFVIQQEAMVGNDVIKQMGE